MTQEPNSIEIDLLPLQLFSERVSEGWTALPGHPLYKPPDYAPRPNPHSEAHLMTFCVTPREPTEHHGGRAMRARTSAFTLYVTGTRFGLSWYSLELVRLVEEELSPPVQTLTIH
ncbi:hypothetical protein [Sinorhizobium americanum]|uniref:Uncharacterized protein n=1 Tax=Sinorhizobium americanum TaxID=194963 RepID=A0A4R2AN29_9HYPH|nr:hypothetical protein [Sinorhizobium americanum]TCN15048.1 hypothetical protein EV184_1495 [Sinorhizobium americanum]